VNYVTTLGFIALGGAVGACSRFLISELAVNLFGKGFPYGTLGVNVLGSFLMGMLFVLIEQGVIAGSPWRQLIGLGMLGALTTFSTFSMDNFILLQSGEWLKLGLNLVLNVVLCLLAVAAGYYLLHKPELI
jgi:CrcB protein